MKHNTNLVDFKVSEYMEPSDESDSEKTFKELLEELNCYCNANKSNAIYDDIYELLQSVWHHLQLFYIHVKRLPKQLRNWTIAQ